MYIICILILGIILFISFVIKLKLYDPIVLMTALWEILIIVHWLSGNELLPATDKALGLILMGIILFDIGCFFGKKVTFRIDSWERIKLHHIHDNGKKYIVKIRDGFIIGLLFLGIAVSFSSARVAWDYLRTGVTLWQIRYMLSDRIFVSNVVHVLYTYIISPITYLIIPVSAYKLLRKEKYSKCIFILVSFLILLQVITKAGRLILLYFLLSIAVMFVISLSKGLIKKKSIVKFFVLFSVVFISLFMISSLRESNLIDSFRKYSVSSISFFSIKLDNFDLEYANGGFSWFGVLSPVYNSIDWILGLDLSENTNALIKYIDSPVVIERSGKPFNFFATAFFRFYGDGGGICVVFFSFIWGIICYFYYKKMFSEPNFKTVFCYNLIVYSIAISVMTFAFADFGFFASFILINFVTRREKLTDDG